MTYLARDNAVAWRGEPWHRAHPGVFPAHYADVYFSCPCRALWRAWSGELLDAVPCEAHR